MPIRYCKHKDCTNFQAMGFGGYCHQHKTEDSGYERKQVAAERKKAAKNTAQKLRATENPKNKNQTTVLQDKVEKEKWFRLVREKLTGWCQCGCGEKSSKNDYKNLEGKIESHFRSSISHIFPKKDFHSVKYHLENYVERNFWLGCHTQMDNTSIERWVNFADWDNIKRKFHILEPLLTDEEKTYKFYSQLKTLVENN